MHLAGRQRPYYRIMECSWAVNRYCRSYSDYHKQTVDQSGRVSLFPFFTHSSLNDGPLQSQLVNTGIWSTIVRRDTARMTLKIIMKDQQSIVLMVAMQVSFEEWELKLASEMKKAIPLQQELILEQLEFPNSALEFKASPRTECISFRYMMGRQKFCFQLDFSDALQCCMCYQTMFRFGLLHPQWAAFQSMEMMELENMRHHVEVPNDVAKDAEAGDSNHPPNDRHEEDLTAMFTPSQQPLFSQKYLPNSAEGVLPEVPLDSQAIDLRSKSLDLEDENVFLPLSFQDYGY